jgi:hypothetical protein
VPDSTRTALLAALTAAALLLTAAPAAHAAAWLPPIPVSADDQNVAHSAVTMAGNGDVVAIWTPSSGGMWASIRPAGGSFSAPVQISSGTGAIFSSRPALTVDAAGNAVAAWSQFDGSFYRIRAAFRPAGGAFGPMETISAAGRQAIEPDTALDGAANAIVVWHRSDGTRNRVQWSYRPAGGSFPAAGTTITSGGNTDQEYPRLAMDPAGNAVVAYQAYEQPSNVTYVRYQERPAGGVFPGAAGEKAPVPENGNGSPPEFGSMDVGLGDGEIAFVWHRFEGATNDRFRAAVRTFGAPEAMGTQVLDSSGGMDEIRLAMAPSGEAVAVWSTSDGNDVLWAARAAGGAFGASADLAPSAAIADDVAVGLDGLGNAIATWFETGPSTAWAAMRPAGGTFGAPQELFGGGPGIVFHGPSVGGDSQGNGFAAAVRSESGAGLPRLNVAGWDPVPPTLDGLTIPPLGLNPIAFSVSPFDRWGPVTASWDFGDGSSAAGTNVSHSFPNPGGTYNVTATGTDAAGNSASASGLVAVNGPPVLGRVTLRHRIFSVTARRTALRAQRGRRAGRGTVFRYSVSEPARVTIRIDRRVRRGRYRRAGRTLVRNVPAGRVRTRFSGRIGRRALRPGRYRATVRATDGAGLRSNPRRVTFRVVRR